MGLRLVFSTLMNTTFRKPWLRLFASALGASVLFGCKSPSAPTVDAPGSISSTPVQIVATWDSIADVDLHVVEPSGTEIYWDNPGPTTSGGMLDADANNDCRTATDKETVKWAMNAPNGAYTVRLDYYTNCNTVALTNYSVAITNGGTTLAPITGSFTGIGDLGALGAGRLITTFTHTSQSLVARNEPSDLFRLVASLATSALPRR